MMNSQLSLVCYLEIEVMLRGESAHGHKPGGLSRPFGEMWFATLTEAVPTGRVGLGL